VAGERSWILPGVSSVVLIMWMSTCSWLAWASDSGFCLSKLGLLDKTFGLKFPPLSVLSPLISVFFPFLPPFHLPFLLFSFFLLPYAFFLCILSSPSCRLVKNRGSFVKSVNCPVKKPGDELWPTNSPKFFTWSKLCPRSIGIEATGYWLTVL